MILFSLHHKIFKPTKIPDKGNAGKKGTSKVVSLIAPNPLDYRPAINYRPGFFFKAFSKEPWEQDFQTVPLVIYSDSLNFRLH